MNFFLRILLFVITLTLSFSSIEKDAVHSLPDYEYKGLFYSGYLSSNSVKNFHYIFNEADFDSDKKPLVLWLNGGPGCSSLEGWAKENGPMRLDKNGKFQMNEYSWHKSAKMLYIDSPGDVGFSYIDSQEIYEKEINDDIAANDNLNALIDFFNKFQNYKGRDFYIAGESYAGIYIPMLAYNIIMYNKKVVESKKIHLRGILVGNGVADFSNDSLNAKYDFLFAHHITSYENRIEFIKYCLDEYDKEKCQEIKDEADKCLENINIYDYLQDCELPSTETGERDYFSSYYLKSSWVFPNLKKKQEQLREKLKNNLNKNGENSKKQQLKLSPKCYDDKQMIQYFNREDVKSALHVNTDIIWQLCSDDIYERYDRQSKGSIWAYQILINSGIRILIYNGDTDITVPFNENLAWIENLKLEVEKPWKQWRAFGDNKKISGYYVKYEGLTFCTFKGVGHMVPEWRPKEAFYIFSKFLNNEDF